MELICPIPGLGGPADGALLVHHVIHLALAGFVTIAGAGFLAQAIVTYRRTSPSRLVAVAAAASRPASGSSGTRRCDGTRA
jgi:hypothetical protein